MKVSKLYVLVMTDLLDIPSPTRRACGFQNLVWTPIQSASLVERVLRQGQQGFSQFYPLALYCEKWQKMAKFMRAGK